jgi:hypothetical protein
MGAAIGVPRGRVPPQVAWKGFHHLKPITCSPTHATAVCCRVAAHAALRAPAELIAQLRREPCAAAGIALSPSLLKHAEDQTVVALTAVMRAVSRAGWEGRSFAAWGVVAAPSFFGRASIAYIVQRFVQEGAWGISPHLIPHQSLHAVSGTISQALKCYGPNFGASAGPDASLDALLLAATLLSEGHLPGLWLVLTGYEREHIPAENGQPVNVPPVCEGVALALTRDEDAAGGLSLTIGPAPFRADSLGADAAPEFRLGALIEELAQHPRRAAAQWRLGEMGHVELEMRR